MHENALVVTKMLYDISDVDISDDDISDVDILLARYAANKKVQVCKRSCEENVSTYDNCVLCGEYG